MEKKQSAVEKTRQLILAGKVTQALKYLEGLSRDVEISDSLLALRAVAYFQVLDITSAIRDIKKAMVLNPSSIEYQKHLAVFYYNGLEYQQALDLYQKLALIEPQNFDVYKYMGLTYKALGQLDNASISFKKALELKKDDSVVLNSLGLTLLDAGSHQEALLFFKMALKKSTNAAMIHDNIAMVLQELGDLEEAEAHLKKAIELNPSFCKAYYHLANIKRYKSLPKNLVAQSEELLNNDLHPDERAEILFSLGKFYDDAGSYEKAFYYFKEANSVTGISFDVSKLKNAAHKVKNFFTKSFFDRDAREQGYREGPIFILGMPRSGTTLLEQMLSQHKEISACGELTLVGEIVAKIVKKYGSYPECFAKIDLSESKKYQEMYFNTLQDLRQSRSILGYHKSDAKLLSPNAHSENETKNEKFEWSQEKTRFITDKMPANFQYIGVILKIFPKAKIIWCHRDPRDVCLSCFFTHFKTRIPYAYNLETLTEYSIEYHALMKHWQDVSPIEIHKVCYDSLVSDPEKVMKKVFEYLKLSWDAECLEFFKAKNPVSTASAAQVRQPIYNHAKKRWENYSLLIEEMTKRFKDEHLI